jgi:hypothetical protein
MSTSLRAVPEFQLQDLPMAARVGRWASAKTEKWRLTKFGRRRQQKERISKVSHDRVAWYTTLRIHLHQGNGIIAIYN